MQTTLVCKYLITEHMHNTRALSMSRVCGGRKWSAILCSDMFLLPAHTIMMYSRVSPIPCQSYIRVLPHIISLCVSLHKETYLIYRQSARTVRAVHSILCISAGVRWRPPLFPCTIHCVASPITHCGDLHCSQACLNDYSLQHVPVT